MSTTSNRYSKPSTGRGGRQPAASPRCSNPLCGRAVPATGALELAQDGNHWDLCGIDCVREFMGLSIARCGRLELLAAEGIPEGSPS